MKVKREILERIMSTLIHEVGDTRICPRCGKDFIPEDPTSDDASKQFDKLKAILAAPKPAKTPKPPLDITGSANMTTDQLREQIRQMLQEDPSLLDSVPEPLAMSQAEAILYTPRIAKVSTPEPDEPTMANWMDACLTYERNPDAWKLYRSISIEAHRLSRGANG